jgi:hypothetical protein
MQFFGIGQPYLFLLLETLALWIFRLDVWLPRPLKLQRMVVSLLGSLLSLLAFPSRTWVLSLGKLFDVNNFKIKVLSQRFYRHTLNISHVFY